MKAIIIDQFGGRENLHLVDIAPPKLEPHEIIVDIYATSVNPIDYKVREGKNPHLRFPIILGGDIAGIVAEKGKDVSRFSIGDRVFATPQKIPGGTYAEKVAVAENVVSRLPINCSFQESAAIPMAALTAWQNLKERMQLKKREHVLIIGGAGGVGSFAIQMAKHLGAEVTAIGSSDSQKLMKKLGADRTVDYTKVEAIKAVGQVNAVFDCVGGEQQMQWFESIKKGGTFISIARKPDPAAAKNAGVSAAFTSISPNRRLMNEIRDLVEAEFVRPIITKVFPFEEQAVQEAHKHIEKGHTKGKLVIEIKRDSRW